jgi:hypothetical protein
MKAGDLWLADHFFQSALQSTALMQPGPLKNRLEAEINCLLAFIARDTADNLGKWDETKTSNECKKVHKVMKS